MGKTATVKREAGEPDSDVEFIFDGDSFLESLVPGAETWEPSGTAAVASGALEPEAAVEPLSAGEAVVGPVAGNAGPVAELRAQVLRQS